MMGGYFSILGKGSDFQVSSFDMQMICPPYGSKLSLRSNEYLIELAQL